MRAIRLIPAAPTAARKALNCSSGFRTTEGKLAKRTQKPDLLGFRFQERRDPVSCERLHPARHDTPATPMHRVAMLKALIPYSVFDAVGFLQTRLQSLHEPRARPADHEICEKTLMLQGFSSAAARTATAQQRRDRRPRQQSTFRQQRYLRDRRHFVAAAFASRQLLPRGFDLVGSF